MAFGRGTRQDVRAGVGLHRRILHGARLAGPDANATRTRYGIPAGLLDGDPPLRVLEHIFVGSKAQWDAISDNAPCLDTM